MKGCQKHQGDIIDATTSDDCSDKGNAHVTYVNDTNSEVKYKLFKVEETQHAYQRKENAWRVFLSMIERKILMKNAEEELKWVSITHDITI